MRQGLSTSTLQRVYRGLARRYDLQHSIITFASDQRGRKLLVRHCVHEGDRVLDCGAGTGSTGLLAAAKAGPAGRVTLFDLSEDMLAVARERATRRDLRDRVEFATGDMVHLPFDDGSFDVVLSTYSLCPVYDPAQGALELYRVTRPGGILGIGHSTEPRNALVRFLADRIEDLAWRLPWLSMGCRAVDVLPALQRAGAKVRLVRRIGVPLWPFLVFVVDKPASCTTSAWSTGTSPTVPSTGTGTSTTRRGRS